MNEPSPAPKAPRFGWLRAACFYYVSCLLTLLTFFIGVPLRLFTPGSARASHVIARLWGKAMLLQFGCGVKREGPGHFEGGQARMIVANHASYLDVCALFGWFPGEGRFVLKQELMRLPFIGWFAKLTGHFLLDRSDPREGKRVLDRAAARAKRYGLSPIVFPEGTRTHDGRLGELKAGVFQLAIAAGIPIQPVAIFGTYDRMPRGASYPRYGGEIVMKVGEPISIEGMKGGPGRRALAEKVVQAFHDLGVE